MEVENIFFLRFLVINAENAAHKSEKFSAMATRTRHEYLKDLATNYVTNTTLETGAKGKGKLLNALTIHVVIMILVSYVNIGVGAEYSCQTLFILRYFEVNKEEGEGATTNLPRESFPRCIGLECTGNVAYL